MGITKKPVKYAVIDAFTDSEFKGNPAAVCLLEEERENEWLQSVAAEFNISETSYLIPFPVSDSPHPRFHLRWFTPVTEVELCGHATLAAAHFCFTSGLVKENTVEFSTLSGILTAHKVIELKESEKGTVRDRNSRHQGRSFHRFNPGTSKVIGSSVIDMKKTASDDLFVVLPSAKAVTDMRVDLEEVKKCPGRGLIISAAAPSGSEFDFFSRFFCPKYGIDEDPVCGSAHCALAWYWSKKMGKSDFTAFAASPRSGILKLQLDEQKNRVKLRGKAVTVMEGSVIV
ncbi:hypothetical protein SOVF_008630 isoform B [Spinacia oleracea]|nr:hypothetical protein SOVF_008630 isoform B [Spinacia oleracea]